MLHFKMNEFHFLCYIIIYTYFDYDWYDSWTWPFFSVSQSRKIIALISYNIKCHKQPLRLRVSPKIELYSVMNWEKRL